MKSKLTKLVTLLTILTMGITNLWAQTSWVRLDSIDFTNTTNFPATTYLSSTADVKATVNGVFFWAKKGSKALKVNDGVEGVDFGGQNIGSNGQHGVAVPVTGVNGSLKVIVYHDYNNTSANHKVGISHATGNDPSVAQTFDQTPSNSGTKNKNEFIFTKASLTGADYIVWIGESSSSYTHFKKVAIYTEAPTGYSVTYVENGHGANQADLTGQTALPATLPTLSESGWIFGGWFTDEGLTEAAVPGATLSANTTLYAKWTEDSSITKYSVTYDLNGASGDAPTQADVAEGTNITLAAAPTWAGHGFDGWLCDIDSEVKAAGASYTMTAANTTFTAQWHELDCKLYSLTGEIGSAVKTAGTATVNDGVSIIISNTDARVKLTPGEGTFKSGDVITISGYTGNASKKFGVYVKNAAGSSNIATVEEANLGDGFASATLSADAEYVFLARKEGTTMNVLTCEIHRSCAAGADAGLAYATASVDKITTDAAFTNALTNANGLVIASYKSSDASVATVNAQNGQVTIVGVGDATITAYSAIQTKAGTLYAAGTASYTLHVAAPPTYTVTYDANGGSGTMTDANEYAAGAEVTLLANTFTAPDASHTWSAWVVTDAGDNVVAISEGKFIMPASNATITAQWALITDFDVRFFPGYGANDQIGTTQSISTGDHATAEATPSRDGYRFLGWSTDGTEANIVDVASYGITAATDFTAVWVQQFEVTFNLQGHGATIAAQNVDNGGKVSKPADPYEGGQEFGGWYKEAACTNAWDFATDVVTSATELFAKWTAFTGCAMLVPATSGSALADGDEVDLQASSTGGSIYALAKSENLTYTANGLQFGSTSGVKARVVLNNDLAVGTTISMKLVAAGDKTRGLFLYDASGNKINAFTCWVEGTNPATNGAVETFTYTVTAGDGLEGTNEFQLWRNNTVILNTLKVESCGSAVIFHDLTSAVDPAGMGTVTLSASSVREGHTATAEYSAIDPAYEFDEWQISGTDASIADASANPAVITMGTADAVVTLKLKVATVKHNVTFNTHGGSAVAAQEVEDGANPVEPTAPTKDEYIFQGWAEVEDGAIVDVTSFAITADKEFHAIWVAEPAGIKLLDGSTVNHTNFITGVTADETVEFKGNTVNYAKFSGTVSSVSGVKDLTRVIAYNATTNQTKIRISAHNNSTSARNILVKGVVEGSTDVEDLATIALGNKEDKVSDWIEFDNAANRTIYIFVPSSAGDVYFTQVKVIESGATPMKSAGQVDYSINLNKGRIFGVKETDHAFEGATYNLSSDYTALNTGYAKIKSSSISFDVASPVLMTVTTTNNKTYYVTEGSAGTDNETAKTGASEFSLTAGTWYITGDAAAEVQITNIAFSAPKCEQPTITTQPATKIDFPAGDLTATVVAEVTDGGTLSYQWYDASDDSEVAGATNATLTTTTEGTYYVIVTNSLADHADNFIKSDNATLGYIDLTDATLSALSYGGTSITLSDGVYEYDVNLDEGTVDVPLLAATATMAAYGATAVPTDAAAFVNYEATSTVLVTAADGTTTQTYTVNFHVDHLIAALVDVSTDMTWDFSKANDGTAAGSSLCTDAILANVAGIVNNANFESDNIMATANKFTDNKLQASMIKFHTTVDGRIKVVFSNTGSKTSERYLVVNGVKTNSGSKDKTAVTYYGFVPAGDVVLTVVEGDGNMLNFTSVEFNVPDYTRTAMLGNGVLGTLCVDHNVPVEGIQGATFYELAGKNAEGKIAFDQITTGQLDAGVPYVFQAHGDNLALYYGSETEAAPVNGNGMYGTFSQLVLSGSDLDDVYYFAQKALWSCTDLIANSQSLTIPANRAYVKFSELPSAMAPAPGRIRMTLNVNGAPQVTTGMENLENSETPVKMMINGQMFILRGEKLYDATGRLVK